MENRISLLAKLPALLLLLHAAHAGPSPLFEGDAVVKASLTGPLSSLFEDVNSSNELPFILRADGVEHSINVSVRGKSRRRECSFPPLRINFAGDETAQSIFDGQDRLKLVTHCRRQDSSQSDVLQEYAAYRIFNLLSAFSYRVRLLHITYEDTDGDAREDGLLRYGFVIESSSDLADRINGQPSNVTEVSLGSLDDHQAATVYIFQYLIGNTDWSLVTGDGDETCCHNGDLFDIGADRYYVPYDFDLSGLVNARYARPDPSLRISRVTQRVYRGYCVSMDALRNALGALKSRKADILDLIANLPGLSRKEIAATTKYLERFFAQAGDEEKILKTFERRCL